MRGHGVAAILLALLPACVAAQQPAAVVIDAGPTVQVRRIAGDTIRASAGLRLVPGEELIVPPGTTATVLFRSGQLQRVSTRLVIGGSAAGGAVQGTASASRVALGEKTVALRPGGRVRPMAGAPVQVSPRNGVLVAGAPLFTWYSVPGAQSYRVQWRAATTGELLRLEAQDTVLGLPLDSPFFRPGETYEWVVIPSDSGRVATPVSFRLLNEAAKADWSAELRRIDGLPLPRTARGLLRLFTHIETGLYYEALSEWSAWQDAGGTASSELLALMDSVRLATGLPPADPRLK